MRVLIIEDEETLRNQICEVSMVLKSFAKSEKKVICTRFLFSLRVTDGRTV